MARISIANRPAKDSTGQGNTSAVSTATPSCFSLLLPLLLVVLLLLVLLVVLLLVLVLLVLLLLLRSM
jgi:hypothetical protein